MRIRMWSIGMSLPLGCDWPWVSAGSAPALYPQAARCVFASSSLGGVTARSHEGGVTIAEPPTPPPAPPPPLPSSDVLHERTARVASAAPAEIALNRMRRRLS